MTGVRRCPGLDDWMHRMRSRDEGYQDNTLIFSSGAW